ncbi:MAG: hypothetical protein HYU66_03380 [Armatimonadetes bacterium]|nr:hypothetical protein [Armatimonadota bacterium]
MFDTLPGTTALTDDGDLAWEMVEGLHRYLDRATAEAPARRPTSRPPAEGRALLAKMLGVVDEREAPELRILGPVPVASSPDYTVYGAIWSVLPGLEAEGLLLEPNGEPVMDVVALPDCEVSPEALCGVEPGLPPEMQLARRLVEQGCRVLVPLLIDRKSGLAGNPRLVMTRLPHREFIYRAAYPLGRQMVGYEIQKVLAAVDWFVSDVERPVGVFGHGEGGRLALYAAALDERVAVAGVSGAFGPREELWREPIDHNIWRLVSDFGDSGVAALIAPRKLVVHAGAGPEMEVPINPPDRVGGPTPGRLGTPPFAEVSAECDRARALAPELKLVLAEDADAALLGFLGVAGGGTGSQAASGTPPEVIEPVDVAARFARQYRQLVQFDEDLIMGSEMRREAFWSKADRSSSPAFARSAEWYREHYWTEVIGALREPALPPNPRAKLWCDTDRVRGWQVVLNVLPDVFAYGILLLPKDLRPDERRPVVVCQHGLEGRPEILCDPANDEESYHRYAYRLAERGYIVFAPQNPYIGMDHFRQTVRKANPLGLNLYSFIVRQHQAIVAWLAGLPFVDPQRIAYYGLSYGGKTAMFLTPLVPEYCLVICSGNFSDWIRKVASTHFRNGYVFTAEYEMPEFGLGDTFGHLEQAQLIFPRPFMVERGHGDGVSPDEWVGYEFAKVYRHYDLMGLGERCVIEWFDGPHTIHGVGTFEFLDRWLRG